MKSTTVATPMEGSKNKLSLINLNIATGNDGTFRKVENFISSQVNVKPKEIKSNISYKLIIAFRK